MGLFRKSAKHRNESIMASATLGCLLSIVALPLLFLNEGRAVKTSRALHEGAGLVVSVDASAVDAANDGKFVHISGKAQTVETLTDEQFGVSVNAIRLVRSVESYQWQEVKEEVTRRGKDGKSTKATEYAYEKGWSSERIDSSKFHEAESHANPAELPFAAKTYQASEVRVGEYQLPKSLVDQIGSSEPVVVDLSHVDPSLAANVQPDGGTQSSATGFYWTTAPDSSPEEPAIGDTRIHFQIVKATDVSVMAQQSGKSIKPFKTHSGQSLNMLAMGQVSAEEMIENAESRNTVFTWALRVFGTALLMVGIGLALQPITSLSNWIPVAGRLVGAGATFVAILLGGGIALLTIAFAWILFRPVIAVLLIAAAVALLWAVFRKPGNRTSTPPPVPVAG